MSDSDADNDIAEVPATNGAPKASKPDKQEELKAAEKCVTAFMRCVFGGMLNEKQLEAGLKKASKDPDARRLFKMLARPAAANGKQGKRGNGEKKEKSHLVRSAYQVFMTDAMHYLNQHAGEQGADGGAIKNIPLTQVALLWKRLPDDMKAEMNGRFNTVKDRINAQVRDGATSVDAHAELEKLNKEQKLKPYNYAALLQKYGSADDAAAGGKGNGNGGAAAAPAAAGPSKALGSGGDAEKKRKHDDDEARREKKKRKKDKEKKEVAEGGNGSGKRDGDKEEKKKKKKHKHREEGGGAEA